MPVRRCPGRPPVGSPATTKEPAGVRRTAFGARNALARGTGVAALLVVAGVHLQLYAGEEYARIPTIGWLFLLTVASAVVLAVALLVSRRLIVGLAVSTFAAGVLGGYVLSLLLPSGIFAFKEPGVSYSGACSMGAEAVAVAAGLQLAMAGRGGRRNDLRPVHERG